MDPGSGKVGDHIGVQATEAIAISIEKEGAPASSPAAVVLAAAGSDGKPNAMLMGETLTPGFAESVILAVSKP